MTDASLGSIRSSIRCFVGLPLPEVWQCGLDALTQRLAGRLASRISWTRPGNWHVTLQFLGEVEQARVSELVAALRAVSFVPFTLRLGETGFFVQQGAASHAPRTLWVGLAQGGEACARLAETVRMQLGPCGFAPEAREYRPHVTLGRVKAAVGGDDWKAAGRELAQEFSGAGFPAALAGEMVLWRSVLGPQGPKYAALERFPARDHGGGPDGRSA